MRLLVLLLVVVLAVWLIRRAFRVADKGDVPQKPAIEGELVSCARCGLNLPRGEARQADGALYCSDEHARLGKAG